ncbi:MULTISPECIES: DUF305 domain-containing protein [unclassified Pseudonocardia]|uniref:DUF305 domain-containing protein n=1 Tax=unclassified Pseudonocardia TaxID=2619320 RepID=UPI00094B7366|nr:DUF305 domain-containing protein [Pseudonocardia sp. Ae707_Ps1]OLM19885.1 putative lipoprotein [Pseudonocardia sp. Ae707_Ps1]
MTTTHAAALAAATITAALVLAGCSGGTAAEPAAPAAAPPAATAAPGADARHGDADIAFAQGMIPHHRQAVEMARLAEGRASGDGVRRLAAAIEAAQGPEIEQLRGFLAAWGAPESAGAAMEHGAHGGHGDMSGMMTADDMAELERATGPAFDRRFLELMIVHHEGAVAMAGAELADGENPQARELAQRIVDAQRSEIDAMRGMLDRA